MMRELIKVLKAAGDKNRMRILKMLQHKKMCVCELAAVLEIKQPSVSKHLSILRDAGLIQDERNGQWMDYSLCKEKINRYAPDIQASIENWLKDDAIIKRDMKKTQKLCREVLCKKE